MGPASRLPWHEDDPLFRGAGAAAPSLYPDRMVRSTLAQPVGREVQPDGRIRHWGPVHLSGEALPRYLRVVTLSDGETVHNAFLDRGFREGTQ